MKRSEGVDQLATGLSKFQGSVPKIIHNKEVFKRGKDGKPDQRYTYADLDIIWDTIRKPFAESGLSLVQDVITTEANTLLIETTLMHSSGQWVQTSCPIIEPKEYGYVPMQTLGALITYAKRYSLCATIGITADSDQDANEDAEVKPKEVMRTVQKTSPASHTIKSPNTTAAVTKPIPNEANDLMKITIQGQVKLLSVAK
jgi:hypothetical protein